MNKKLLYIFAIGSLLYIGIFFLPQSNCCTNDDPETLRHESNTVAAVNGDADAARILYYDYLKSGNTGQAFTWLRIGAMNGANDLVIIYIKEYKKLSPDMQKKEVKILIKNIQKNNVKSILSQIGI